MIEIGKYNTLKAARQIAHGMVLLDAEGDDVLLPKKFVPEGLAPGDEVEVFVYTDSEDWPVATTQRPKAILGQFAYLTVKDVTTFGAFLDWGLDKDLLAPFSEQAHKMERGKSYLVYLLLDEQTDRLIASSKINRYLELENIQLKEGEEVNLLIGPPTDIGFIAIINHRYRGLLYKNELFRPVQSGAQCKGFVKTIRPDKKIDLSLRKPGYAHVEPNAERILQLLEQNNGFLNLHDKSSPAEITARLQMSKKTFKKAIGALYKQRLIRIEEDGIYLV
ncbi:MAG: GntR family transcriptional regulator [Phaeodactylibacter sp.]|nr:GntR family transcriptional regulator [Phaeodactylibacter sp.]MCB9264213.1 GntR family transcriptional regulator [Lewinellaceae bacterium]MCB9291269.1 GntR family transcriptional regulator [Lewinellaceae bacterium]